MNGLTCDMCGNELLIDDDVRYLAEIQVYTAYDPLEITATDLKQNFTKKISDLVRKLSTIDPEAAQNSIYKAICFDLCPGCQREYLNNPLPGSKMVHKTDQRN